MEDRNAMTVSTKQPGRVWQLVSLVLAVLLLIMTSLFIWQVVKSSTEAELPSTPQSPASSGSLLTSPCPLLPDLHPLPKTLPPGISGVLDTLGSQMGLLVHRRLSIPAISANIFYRERVLWSGHYGSKKRGGDEAKPDGNTRYRIASVSKIFPVLMAYKLYEQGLIGSLDDPFNKYAPDFYMKNVFTRDNITIREMTSQMSGLPREAPCIYNCTETSTAEQLELLHKRSLVKTPYTQPSYSNLAYALLGRVLSQNVLNQTYESWVTDNILKPLGMRNTGFEITPAVEANMAFPYNISGGAIKFMKTGWIGPAAEMYSTLNDLTKLAVMFAQPHKQNLFREDTLREILLPQHVAQDGRTLWGAPWEMMFLHGFAVRGKAGNIDSYNSFVSVIPELQLGMNVLVSAAPITGSSSVAVLATEQVYDALLPVFNETMFELGKNAPFPIPAEPYVGKYAVKSVNAITNQVQNFLVTVSEHSGRLVVNTEFGLKIFEIRYVGDPLLFQCKLARPGMSCSAERSGAYHELYFDKPSAGLSPGFRLPGLLRMSAVRVSRASRPSALSAQEPDFSWLQQIY